MWTAGFKYRCRKTESLVHWSVLHTEQQKTDLDCSVVHWCMLHTEQQKTDLDCSVVH